ncbi:MAG: hypothetical protein JO110_29225 [Acetobacteraceae bacterium]|nr:hypothetical protein [Acetobacteraceae bacterium]
MSDQPENLILVYLRRLDAKMDRIIEDVQDLKRRVTSLENAVARLPHFMGDLRTDYAGLQLRIDRIEGRLDRIEKRLDIVE